MKILMVLTSHDQLGNSGRRTDLSPDIQTSARFSRSKRCGALSANHLAPAFPQCPLRRATPPSQAAHPTPAPRNYHIANLTPSISPGFYLQCEISDVL